MAMGRCWGSGNGSVTLRCICSILLTSFDVFAIHPGLKTLLDITSSVRLGMIDTRAALSRPAPRAPRPALLQMISQSSGSKDRTLPAPLSASLVEMNSQIHLPPRDPAYCPAAYVPHRAHARTQREAGNNNVMHFVSTPSKVGL
jgi:hypothetical protein